MDVVISGHAGVALIVDGAALASIHMDQPEKVIPRQECEIHLLFGGARDLQFVADVDLEQVRAQLELSSAKIDALHLALIVLDPELSQETRREAVLELNELMDLLEISDSLERVLHAHPLPSSADLAGGLELSASQAPKVQDLLLTLSALQEAISEVHRAWEAIPAKILDREGDRGEMRALFVREGLFKELVLNREEGAPIDSFLLSSSLRPALHSVPGYRTILQEWVTHFQAGTRFAEAARDGIVKNPQGVLGSMDELQQEIVISELVLHEAAQNFEVVEQADVPDDLSSHAAQLLEQLMPQLAPKVLKKYRIPQEDVEDILMDVQLLFFYKIGTIRDHQSWLLGSIRNRCISYWRRRRHQLYTSIDSTLSGEISETTATQNESALREKLTNLVDELPLPLGSRLRLRYGLAPGSKENSGWARIHESVTRSFGGSRGFKSTRRVGKAS